MALGDLNPATWRIDVYEMKPNSPFAGVVTDLSNLYTSDLTITKQRNYPDEIQFTLDLQQLEERAKAINVQSRGIIEPYRHKIRCYRNNKFVAQGIVTKVTANLNNTEKNTLEVQCADTLSLFEKRLIHQDYGEGSWADFAKEVIKDAQHEPNRIYNYAFEGDGVSVDNAWFRGWLYTPGEATLRDFPEWEPNHLYSMYDTCTHNAKFWEAKEHAFYSGETFSESNWTLLGVLDDETGDVAGAYGVWREDEEEPGPTGTALGGWGGTSSCHMTAKSFEVNNGAVKSISMKDSVVSTSLVAPITSGDANGPRLPQQYQEVEYIEQTIATSSTGTQVSYISTGISTGKYDNRLKITLDIQPTSGSATNVWHAIIAGGYGQDGSNFQFAPQVNFAIHGDNNRYCYEVPTSKTPGQGNQAVTSSVTAGTARRTLVYDMRAEKKQSLTILNADGTTAGTVSSTYTLAEDRPDVSLSLFGRSFTTPGTSGSNRNGTCGFTGKLFSCKIEDSTRVLRDFVPCYERSTGAVGLYDLQNGVFYTNAGPGEFSKGEDVIYPSEVITTERKLTEYSIDNQERDQILSVDLDKFMKRFMAKWPIEEYPNYEAPGRLTLADPATDIFPPPEAQGASLALWINPGEIDEYGITPYFDSALLLWSGDDLDDSFLAVLDAWGIETDYSPVIEVLDGVSHVLPIGAAFQSYVTFDGEKNTTHTPPDTGHIHTRVMARSGVNYSDGYTIQGSTITGDVITSVDKDTFFQQLEKTYPSIISSGDFVKTMTAAQDNDYNVTVTMSTTKGKTYNLGTWNRLDGDNFESALADWGIKMKALYVGSVTYTDASGVSQTAHLKSTADVALLAHNPSATYWPSKEEWSTTIDGQEIESSQIIKVELTELFEGELGNGFLYSCTNLTALDMSNATIKNFGRCFLAYCTNLNSAVTVPPMTALPNYFLYEARAFNQPLTLPEGMTSIGMGCLYGATTFNKSITLPSTLTSIGTGFLDGCYAFNTALTLPSGLRTIGDSFLTSCMAFNKSLALPEGLQSIGDQFMEYCTSFNQNLTLPSTLTYINDRDFMYKCTSMCSTINVGNLPTSILKGNNHVYTLSCGSFNNAQYQTGIGITGANKAAWLSFLPNLTSMPYRKLRSV